MQSRVELLLLIQSRGRKEINLEASDGASYASSGVDSLLKSLHYPISDGIQRRTGNLSPSITSHWRCIVTLRMCVSVEVTLAWIIIDADGCSAGAKSHVAEDTLHTAGVAPCFHVPVEKQVNTVNASLSDHRIFDCCRSLTNLGSSDAADTDGLHEPAKHRMFRDIHKRINAVRRDNMVSLSEVNLGEPWSSSIAELLADETGSQQVFVGDMLEDLNEDFGW